MPGVIRTERWMRQGGNLLRPGRPNRVPPAPPGIAYDWSSTNLPWAYSSSNDWEARIPAGIARADIQTGSSDFFTNLRNTVNAAPGRVLVNLGIGDYVIDRVRLIGQSYAQGNRQYGYGFWFSKLAGLVGEGPDKTFVSWAPNIPIYDTNGTTDITTDVFNYLSTMTSGESGNPLSLGFARIDGSQSGPCFIGGLTMRAPDGRMLNSVDASVSGGSNLVYVPQPMPHQGLTFYPGAYGVMSHVRLQATGRAMTSLPPFEMGNITSQKCSLDMYNIESDGRLSSVYDSTQPRRATTIMVNNEIYNHLEDFWGHHSNVSRYAANDQNNTATGTYSAIRTKFDNITNTQNVDLALRPDGQSLGGFSNASKMGWESVRGNILLKDMVLVQDNPYMSSSKGTPQHLQFTSVAVDPAAIPGTTKCEVIGGVFRTPVYPDIDGYLTWRITESHWRRDNYANIYVWKDATKTVRKTAHPYTGTWPPTAAYLSANGLSKDTHYIVRPS